MVIGKAMYENLQDSINKVQLAKNRRKGRGPGRHWGKHRDKAVIELRAETDRDKMRRYLRERAP